MNDDHDMTRHLPNAEAMPADFEQTEALPTLVGGVSEQASAVTQALPVEPTQALPRRGVGGRSRHRRCRLPRQRRCR